MTRLALIALRRVHHAVAQDLLTLSPDATAYPHVGDRACSHPPPAARGRVA